MFFKLHLETHFPIIALVASIFSSHTGLQTQSLYYTILLTS